MVAKVCLAGADPVNLDAVSIVETFSGNAGPGLAVHPDGDQFVVTSGSRVYLWSRRAQSCVREIQTDLKGAIYHVAIHPDERRVFVGCLSQGEDELDARVLAYDLTTGDLVATYSPDLYASTSYFDLSPDGQHIVSAGMEALHLWDVTSGRPRWSFKGEYGMAGFHPNGKWVVAWNIGTIEIRMIECGSLVRSFEISAPQAVERGYVNPVFLADGRRSLWTCESEWFGVVDLEAGEVLSWHEAHGEEISSISVSADESRMLTSSQDGTFRVWDLEKSTFHHVNVGEIVWSARFVDGDRRVLATCGSNEIQVYELPD